jgi:FAD-dependent sensor of blue light
MYRMVYVSSAVEHFSERQLEDLLKKSRQNNSLLGLTGMLLYKDGNFMQCLEGPKEAVCTLEAKIKSDPRHQGMAVLLHEDHVESAFGEWAMGFKTLHSRTAREFPGYSDFLNVPLIDEEFQRHPARSMKLLLSFKRAMR